MADGLNKKERELIEAHFEKVNDKLIRDLSQQVEDIRKQVVADRREAGMLIEGLHDQYVRHAKMIDRLWRCLRASHVQVDGSDCDCQECTAIMKRDLDRLCELLGVA